MLTWTYRTCQNLWPVREEMPSLTQDLQAHFKIPALVANSIPNCILLKLNWVTPFITAVVCKAVNATNWSCAAGPLQGSCFSG